MAAAAITAAKVGGASGVRGNKRYRVYDITWTGDYAAGGTAVTPSTFGLRKITEVIPHGGVAVAADLATANVIYYNHATGKFVLYEAAATGLALLEKTDAEAVPTGLTVRVTVVGW